MLYITSNILIQFYKFRFFTIISNRITGTMNLIFLNYLSNCCCCSHGIWFVLFGLEGRLLFIIQRFTKLWSIIFDSKDSLFWTGTMGVSQDVISTSESSSSISSIGLSIVVVLWFLAFTSLSTSFVLSSDVSLVTILLVSSSTLIPSSITRIPSVSESSRDFFVTKLLLPKVSVSLLTSLVLPFDIISLEFFETVFNCLLTSFRTFSVIPLFSSSISFSVSEVTPLVYLHLTNDQDIHLSFEALIVSQILLNSVSVHSNFFLSLKHFNNVYISKESGNVLLTL
ncbi:hypothetical protein AGLY_004648 [Aphis glycines]|uniref:Uncharacterized protein n=1 Tax=Aphis glycines TaxID=307491 RepID=A0A6G0TVS0_APHGL|nr:hypothetical protein AGLY_004648 [Aphis glycines]